MVRQVFKLLVVKHRIKMPGLQVIIGWATGEMASTTSSVAESRSSPSNTTLLCTGPAGQPTLRTVGAEDFFLLTLLIFEGPTVPQMLDSSPLSHRAGRLAYFINNLPLTTPNLLNNSYLIFYSYHTPQAKAWSKFWIWKFLRQDYNPRSYVHPWDAYLKGRPQLGHDGWKSCWSRRRWWSYLGVCRKLCTLQKDKY